MAGKIKQMVDLIIRERTKDNEGLYGVTRARLILKGVHPDKFDSNSPDDPIIIEKLYTIAKEFNIRL